jgi:hypothetical protein
VVAQVWIIGGLLIGVTAFRAIEIGDVANAIVAGTLSVFLTAIGGLTVRGSFERHRGGWLTYVGVAFAFLGVVGFAIWVGSYAIHKLPATDDLIFALVCLAVAALFLALGARRHASYSRAA